MRLFSTVPPLSALPVIIITALALTPACGGGGGSASAPAPPDQGSGTAPPVTPDFTEVDAAFETFIEESAVFDGVSYVVVDAQ